MSMTKISTLLASIALASSSTFVQAYQIAPNPNPFGNTIKIIDEDAENLIAFTSYGSILIESTNGILTNNSYLLFSGGSLNNYGNFEGNGKLTIIESGSLNNYGTMNSSEAEIFQSGINNVGVMNSYGSFRASESSLNNSGTLNSYGSIVIDEMYSRSHMDNTGTLNNYGSLEFSHSTLTNGSGGIFNNYGNSILKNSSGLYNDSILNNYGTLTNKIGTQYPHNGFYNNNIFTNNARLENHTEIYGSGVYTQDAGETINNGIFNQASLQINGGEVSGIGSFTGDVTIANGATVRPGGTLTFNSDFHSSGDLILEIAGTETGQYDALVINGNADFTGGDILFAFNNDFHPSVGDHWNFLLGDSITGLESLNVSFSGLPNSNGIKGDITLNNLGGHMVITSIPEPETYAMLLAGLGFLGFVVRRKKRSLQDK